MEYVLSVVNYMIIFNKEIVFENSEVLDTFCELFRGEAYDEVTRITADTFLTYLRQAYECDQRLTKMIHEKIDERLYPVVSIECHEFADINSIDFYLMCFDEDRKILKREELEFREYCEICFSHLGGLLSKLQVSLDGY